MQKVADDADISVLFFSAGANFWAILGHYWAFSSILGHFWANLANFGSFLGYFGSFLGQFLVLNFVGQKFISAIFITFCISVRVACIASRLAQFGSIGSSPVEGR